MYTLPTPPSLNLQNPLGSLPTPSLPSIPPLPSVPKLPLKRVSGLDYKKDKYEAQKKAQIERMKEKNVQGPLDQAKASLKGIQTQTISDKDKEGTAYSKLMGNVGSTAVGVGGAVFHGIRALAARRKAETNTCVCCKM